MGFLEILLIGIGLSMDAFAVALCKGLAMPKLNRKHALIIAAFFGGFQALMPLLGWLLGSQFERYITSFDHWVAFGLLLFIGGKMIFDVFHDKDENEACMYKLDIKELFLLAVATSIDALAVGITIAFMETNIYSAITIIGVTTFLLALVGVAIGHRFGLRFKKKAEFAGGCVLVLIGIKLLLEGLGILVI